MDNSRPPSPEEPPQDLWSSILDSVSSTRSIPSKQVLLLGESSSGKSTISSALLQKPRIEDKEAARDFALGYDWADVHDETDEADTLARLSVYTVPSSATPYLSLLPHFVPPRSALPHTAVMIVLDWTQPWTFIEQLELWLKWIESWSKGDDSRELEIMREENRERLQSYIQRYSEPLSETLPAASAMGDTLLPLGPGTLTHNSSGVPIIVVCTKADLVDDLSDNVVGGTSGMGGMVKGKGSEWEEQTDGIMQVLRVICLKYGAALFYTTQNPATLHHLRQYLLHMLFVPPAPLGITSGEPIAPHRNPFPFSEKPNTLDRDRIIVPIGWDSWGKIAVLREGFDAKTWNEAWDNDLEAGANVSDVKGSEPSAQALYADLVPDRGVKPQSLPPFNEPMPEQAFLAKNYDENAKKGDRDPRAAFRPQNELPGHIAAGIVGPMGPSSFNLPNVERALTEMEGGLVMSGTGGDRKHARRDGSSRTASALPGALGQSNSGRPPLGSSTLGGSSPPAGQSQHEVLQNFFQSLLSSRDRGAAAATTSGSRPVGNSQNGSSTVGQNQNGSGPDDVGSNSGGTESTEANGEGSSEAE